MPTCKCVCGCGKQSMGSAPLCLRCFKLRHCSRGPSSYYPAKPKKKKIKYAKVSWQPPVVVPDAPQTPLPVDQKLIDELVKQATKLESQRADQEEEKLRNPYAEEY